jgi:hypothetical protein
MTGSAMFIQPELEDSIFAVVEGEDNPTKHAGTFRCCGLEDTVFNHNLLLSDIRKENYNNTEMDRRKDPSIMAKRFFTVKTNKEIESFTLSIADFDEMK